MVTLNPPGTISGVGPGTNTNTSAWPSWFHSAGGYTQDLGVGLTKLPPFSLLANYPTLAKGLSYGIISLGTTAVYGLFRWALERIGFPWFVNGKFGEGDPAFEWILHYLMEEGIWKQSTAYKVSAGNTPNKWAARSGVAMLKSSRAKHRNAEFMPTWESARLFRWKGYWFEVKGTEVVDQMGAMNMRTTSLKVTAYSFNLDVLSDFVEDARKCYMALKAAHVIVHLSDGSRFMPGNYWSQTKRKGRRPLDTVILDKGVIEDLLDDAREFLASEEWYHSAGIPHRRGYLLHGPPGTGKTTTIYSMAGELGLEIYSLSLASNAIDDNLLRQAASTIPKDGILLIEDIDCAFPSREDDDDEQRNKPPVFGMFGPVHSKSMVTMSGLLNVLDGVGSDEGKLFFATTNYIDKLDPAMLRPGRIDKQVEYHLASKEQAHQLFIRWFSTPRGDHILLKSDISLSSLSSEKLKELADQFEQSIPEKEFSTAELQGYLLLFKHDPIGAVARAPGWVESEKEKRRLKEERDKVKKEKAEAKKRNAMGMVMGPTAASGGDNAIAPVVKSTQDPGPVPSSD